ncbi:MAG: DUF2510 domain-containing protein [Coriobacteriia bacterium]|nr:DUF2510 domain-containing protein [Coriobacteriia bacterium]MCL2749739.1 DUF2510 domain-containing protein [Coriobacteriia bacterium]
MNAQVGWYPDPSGDASKLRYWDGLQWTNDITDSRAVARPAQPPQLPVQPTQVPAQPIQQVHPNGSQHVLAQAMDYSPVGGHYYSQAAGGQTNGLAIASLVCGIAGFFTFGFTSVAAIILGAIGRKSTVNKGMATAGLTLGIISLAGVIANLIFYFVALAFMWSMH